MKKSTGQVMCHLKKKKIKFRKIFNILKTSVLFLDCYFFKEAENKND